MHLFVFLTSFCIKKFTLDLVTLCAYAVVLYYTGTVYTLSFIHSIHVYKNIKKTTPDTVLGNKQFNFKFHSISTTLIEYKK